MNDANAKRGAALLGVLLLLAFLLRLAEAWSASFHLDDFHSLHHARAESLGALFQGLRLDNHPPLSFLILWAFRGVLGEGELALRLPNLLIGVGGVLAVWRLARRLGSLEARTWATALFAVSSLHLGFSTDLRMYALLALAVTALVDAVLDVLEEGRGLWRVLLWTFVGMHTHYHFLHTLAVLALALLVLALARPRHRAPLRGMAFALGGAAALSAPWYLWGFLHQLLEHDLAPGGSAVSPTILAEAMVHLLYVRISLGGDVLRLVFLGGATLACLVSVIGAVRWWRHPPGSGLPGSALLLAAAAFGVPAWTAVLAWLFPRAGFEWRYLAGAVGPFAVLVAGRTIFTRPALHRTVLGVIGTSAVLLCVLHVRDAGREDYEGATRFALAELGAEGAVLAADWQPRIFPHSLGWDYYAGRMRGSEAVPTRVPFTDDFALAPEAELAYPRVVCVLRSIPNDVPLLLALREHFPHEEAKRFGEAIWVLTFSRE